jgi:hypothetical protein
MRAVNKTFTALCSFAGLLAFLSSNGVQSKHATAEVIPDEQELKEAQWIVAECVMADRLYGRLRRASVQPGIIP